MARGWDRFYAEGENPKGMVAQVPNNTIIDGGWDNELGDVPPGADPSLNENIPTMVKVRAYERLRPANNGPTIQKTKRR